MSEKTGGNSVPILSYMIEVAIDSSTYSPLATVAFGTNLYSHNALVGGLDYSYKIKAVNKYGEAQTFS
jgi:hypothetical protein